MSAMYPSLEDMKVDQMAQVSINLYYIEIFLIGPMNNESVACVGYIQF